METQNYDFEKDKQETIFEKIFAEKIIGTNYTRYEKYFPDWDIKNNATGVTYEIKRDKKYIKTGNTLAEEWYDLEKKKKGWIQYTKADWLVVFFTDNEYYITNMKTFINDFYNNRNLWIVKDIKQKEGFITRNWVTPLDRIKKTFYNINKKEIKMEIKPLDRWITGD